jgi:hypothetical protein
MRAAEEEEAYMPAGAFLGRWKDFAMADRRALKLIGIMFAALTLMAISTAAVVVAGHAASGVNGEYQIGGPS